MSCPCDKRVHPPQLKIAAGLETIPRQIATFPEFRCALLAALRGKPALAVWRARGEDDLGVMLLEMWAYVCDALAFYDEVIAHEAYLRTARQRPSLRKLVGLLGYVPRPAVAASVKLAVFAEGRQAVTLPIGTAFRSGAFEGNSPQVFELDAAATIHPLVNSFTLKPPRPTFIGIMVQSLLLETGTAALKAGDVVMIQMQTKASWTQVRTVKSAAVVDGEDEEKYLKVTFDSALIFLAFTPLAQVKLYRPTQTAALWRSPSGSKDPDAVQPGTGNTLSVILDGVYRQIRPDDFVLLSVGQQHGWFRVTGTSELAMQVTAGGPTKTLDKAGKEVTVVAPPVSAPATKLALKGTGVTPTKADVPKIVVCYGLVESGVVTAEAKTGIGASDSLQVTGSVEEPEGYDSPTRFLLEDKNEVGLAVGASLSFTTGALTLDQTAQWTGSLATPVKLYGNVVTARRGETVSGEVLGSGDASKASQCFTLKKKPLTYKASPTADNERGVASTLKVYVNSIQWTEVASFYGVEPDAQVYIVRQEDDGESVVTFGDGKRGSRLPTGADNVVAYYRYGAGATSPPAGSITQLAKPVKGLKSVRSPVAAYGGADADAAKELRKYAPRSALIMGRAVSIQDMEAVAAGVSGVRAVRVEWRWDGGKQRPVVHVRYIGKSGIAATISKTLRNLADPSTPIDVKVAVAVTAALSLDVEIDAKYLVATVLANVRTELMDKKTGLLSPEQIGIGRPLYRSQVFEVVVAVSGVKAVQAILWNGKPFTEFAVSPGAGKYFDLENGLLLSGKVASQ